MSRTFVIDCFPESACKYAAGYAIVAIDVIRATTMAVSAASTGRRCLPVDTLAEAFTLKGRLENALLAGELGGDMPDGFEMNNSPAELALRQDIDRPLIMLSSSGTRLMVEARQCEAAFVACFRNALATARHLASAHERIAIIGAGSRGEFREEDQMCCAWIGDWLWSAGYAPETGAAAAVVKRWRGMPAEACARGKSAAYLIRSGQSADLEFVLTHVNDLHAAYSIGQSEILPSLETLLATVASSASPPAMSLRGL